MASKEDLSKAIQQRRTAAEDLTEATAATPEEPKARKERRTYTKEEQETYLNEMKTKGRKGIKLPRINLAFSPDNYKYVKAMSRASGRTVTDFINIIIAEHRENNRNLYEQALYFINEIEK